MFRVKRFVCADIADRPGALYCEPCESECLAYVQNFLSMGLVRSSGSRVAFKIVLGELGTRMYSRYSEHDLPWLLQHHPRRE